MINLKEMQLTLKNDIRILKLQMNRTLKEKRNKHKKQNSFRDFEKQSD